MTHIQANTRATRSGAALAVAQRAPGWVALRWLNGLGLVLLLLALALPLRAQDRPISFADLADRVSPAVVNITTSTTVAAQMDQTMPQPVSYTHLTLPTSDLV